MNAGFAQRDTTPTSGLTLSGFARRRNQPLAGIGDPLAVRTLVVEADGTRVLVVSCDLLALGPELTALLHERLDRVPGLGVPPEHRILCCTHTHSAPASITLLGCGIADPAYWDHVATAVAASAAEAAARLRPVRLTATTVALPGEHYNRRQILANGRVSMAPAPGVAVLKRGPTAETMRLIRLDTPDGQGMAGIIHWAAHPATVCTQWVTADYPGELCRGLAVQHGFPFLFLQGPAGNLNPPFGNQTQDDMLANAGRILARLAGIAWPPAPADTGMSAPVSGTVPLRYAALPRRADRERFHAGMQALAERGEASPDTIAILANILNVKPGTVPDPEEARYFAAVLADWSARWLALSDGCVPAACPLAYTVWRLGPLTFCFVAAEVFVETAQALAAAFPGREIVVVAYSGPVVGYLPTDEALSEGGYETEYAYRFYAHPAPFATGSEPAVVQALCDAIAAVLAGR